jgi:hypothetical protein
MIGASTINETGKTTPPQAARLVSGFDNLAITALVTIGSRDIKIQLAASGHHVWTIFLDDREVIWRGSSMD